MTQPITNNISSLEASLEACPQGLAGRDQRIKLLGSLIATAEGYEWRSKEHERISKIFFKHFPLLPPEDCFPQGKGNEKIKELFSKAEIVLCRKNWSGYFKTTLDSFQKQLPPSQKERFLTLMPLDLVGCDDQASICELNRRNAEGQLDNATFEKFFDHPVKNGYFLYNGSVFIQWISPQLLERILNHYQNNFHINGNIVSAFNEIESFSEACQKLFIFANWYSTHANSWTPYRQAHRLFFILDMAASLLAKNPCSGFKKLTGREIQSSNSSNALLTPSIIRSWIPAKYSSWDVFAADLEDCDKAKGKETLAKFFEG